MVEDERTLAGERIGVFGKGGSGKTTTSVLMAKVLQKQGYEVCVLDADSTNIGLHKVLGIDHPPDSLIDYFGGMIFSGGMVTCPVDDPTPLIGAEVTLDHYLPGSTQKLLRGSPTYLPGRLRVWGRAQAAMARSTKSPGISGCCRIVNPWLH